MALMNHAATVCDWRMHAGIPYALIVAYYEGDQLYYLAKVRNGLSHESAGRFTANSKAWRWMPVPL